MYISKRKGILTNETPHGSQYPSFHETDNNDVLQSITKKVDQTISDRLETPNLRIFAIIRITISFSSWFFIPVSPIYPYQYDQSYHPQDEGDRHGTTEACIFPGSRNKYSSHEHHHKTIIPIHDHDQQPVLTDH